VTILFDHERTPQVIRLEGVVDVGSAAELKAALVSAVERGGATEIAVAEATEMDVTAMQLLWAGKTAGLTVTGPWREAVAASWQDAGFSPAVWADADSSAGNEQ
jgi:hypothetical protein